MKEANAIRIEGHRVLLEEDNLEELEGMDFVGCSNVMKSECPVVAEGKWSKDGQWLFFRTYSASAGYDLEYEEFVEGLIQSKKKVFDSNI